MKEVMNWVLTIGIDKFNLTKEEKDKYLLEIERGAKYVQIRGMILGTSFQTLVQKPALEGKWECDYGKWHDIRVECECQYDYKQISDGTYKRIEKSNSKALKI